MSWKKTLYIYNTNGGDDGTNKIHEFACSYTPGDENCMTLDFFDSCEDALKAAKKKYKDLKFSVCSYCCEK